MITVSDTSPVHYLILIGQAELLQRLFRNILIPEPVAIELQHPRAPIEVRDWIVSHPEWISIRTPKHDYVPEVSGLGSGEIAAIALAIELNADAVLMDDRAAIREARKANLTVLTTFAVLEIAAIKNLIDFREILEVLAETTFRMPPDDVVDEYLRRDIERKSI